MFTVLTVDSSILYLLWPVLTVDSSILYLLWPVLTVGLPGQLLHHLRLQLAVGLPHDAPRVSASLRPPRPPPPPLCSAPLRQHKDTREEGWRGGGVEWKGGGPEINHTGHTGDLSF